MMNDGPEETLILRFSRDCEGQIVCRVEDTRSGETWTALHANQVWSALDSGRLRWPRLVRPSDRDGRPG
jgi:hypothetical protein